MRKELHDLANTMCMASGHIEIATNLMEEHGYTPQPKVYEYLVKAANNLAVMERALKRARDVAQKHTTSDCIPITLTTSAFQQLVNQASKGYEDIDITVIPVRDSAVIRTLPNFQEIGYRILRNVFSNAVKAGAKSIQLRCTEDESTIQVNIIDDGQGMTEDQLNRIGLGNYTTGGTGEGVRDILDDMYMLGGKVSWKSMGKDLGTVVQFVFEKVEEGEEEEGGTVINLKGA